MRANEKTELDLAKAEAHDRANAALVRAEAEFERHRSVGTKLWEVRSKYGGHPDIAAVLTGRARSAGLDVDAVPGAMRWLLLQGKALHAPLRQEIDHGRSGGAPSAGGGRRRVRAGRDRPPSQTLSQPAAGGDPA